MSTPTSIINVCSGVLLNNDYKHTIWFDSAAAQQAYFAGKVVKTFPAYTYIRNSWSIKVDTTMEQARTWSYLYFRNGNGKTYYYFINNIEYINDNTVELFIEMDVMQTYLHEYTLHPCFVEREHSATDSVGENTIDEGLEIGELIINQKSNIDMQELCVLVLSTFDPIQTTEDVTATVLSASYNGIFSGLGIYAVAPSDFKAWGTKLSQLDTWGKSDGIVNMWMYPKALIELADGETWDNGKVTKVVARTKTLTEFVNRNNVLDGYSPRNKKLYTYPFNFLYVSNNSGGAGAYHYEKFTDPTNCQFRLSGALSPEASVKLYPIGYQNVPINYDEGLISGNYPTCAWNQDVYKLWLAQNQNQQGLSLMTAGVTIVGGVATAVATGGAGAAVGLSSAAHGLTQIADTLAQRADKAVQPSQAKGSHSSSVNIVAEHQTYTFMKKSVDRYHAEIIDDFFDVYGYKTNLVKVPNRKVRSTWTYTKTIGCHVSGNICTEDIRKIQSIYDEGVTFWVDGDNIGSYQLSNPTLSIL